VRDDEVRALRAGQILPRGNSIRRLCVRMLRHRGREDLRRECLLLVDRLLLVRRLVDRLRVELRRRLVRRVWILLLPLASVVVLLELSGVRIRHWGRCRTTGSDARMRREGSRGRWVKCQRVLRLLARPHRVGGMRWERKHLEGRAGVKSS
jgi:hypothetical protein